MKKVISCILSALMIFTPMQSAFAVSNETRYVDSDFQQISETGTRLLEDIQPEKAMYGLGNVDFNNLYIGEHIPSYIAREDGFTQSEIRYYPILEDGVWVATLLAVKDSTGSWQLQIGNDFTSYASALSAQDNVALIFDTENSVMSINSAFTYMGNHNIADDNRVALSSLVLRKSTYNAQPILPKRSLAVSQTSTYTNPTNAYLDIPTISQQPNGNACALVCLQSIAKYFGKNHTLQELCDAHPKQGYPDITIDKQTQLDEIARICAAIGLNANPFSRSMSFAQLQSSIVNDRPLIAACIAQTASNYSFGHAVAIRGYTIYTNSPGYAGSFAFMDPWDGTYRAGTVSNSTAYEFTIIRPAGTSSYEAKAFLAIYP